MFGIAEFRTQLKQEFVIQQLNIQSVWQNSTQTLSKPRAFPAP